MNFTSEHMTTSQAQTDWDEPEFIAKEKEAFIEWKGYPITVEIDPGEWLLIEAGFIGYMDEEYGIEVIGEG